MVVDGYKVREIKFILRALFSFLRASLSPLTDLPKVPPTSYTTVGIRHSHNHVGKGHNSSVKGIEE